MKDRRGKKKNHHSSGPKSFNSRAFKFENEGSLIPYVDAYAAAYPKMAGSVKEAGEEAIQIFQASQPTLEFATDSMESSSTPLPVEMQITVLEKFAGPSKGTKVKGFGNVEIRPPQRRGPCKGTIRAPTVTIDEEARKSLAEANELMAAMEKKHTEEIRAMEERMQQMRREFMELIGNRNPNN